MEDSTSTLGVRARTKFAMTPRWVARAGKALSPTAKALYTVIISYADNDSYLAFPGQELLGSDLGVSVSTVHRAMKELEKFGALEVERRRNPRTGNFYGNRYTLVFDDPMTSQDESIPRSTPSVTSESGGLSAMTAEVDPSLPRPNLSSLRSHHPTGDDDSSLAFASPHGDAAVLKALAMTMYLGECEDPDPFIEAFEDQHPGASTDLGHLIWNCWGPEGTTERIGRRIERGRQLGKSDPARWGIAAWVRALPGITHGTLGRA